MMKMMFLDILENCMDFSFPTLVTTLDKGAGECDVVSVTEGLAQGYNRGAGGHVTFRVQNKLTLKRSI